MKILYVTTIGQTMNFFKAFIGELMWEGHIIDIACNDSVSKVSDFFYELGCKVHLLQTSRSPLKRGNISAIRQIRQLVSENHYDIVHCHTPVAAMCTRVACRKIRKHGTKVFYTAHGFHFYKGAPLKNWLFYYPVEWFLAHWTDTLITINKEDYALAQKRMHAKRVEYVPGVGIDLDKFGKCTVDRAAKRRELGIPEDATLLLSVGELNENKNHETVIRAIADLDVYYIIAGRGDLRDHLQAVANELGMTERVKLLGFRNDIGELCEAADVFVFPSFREGLSVALMEAMASGLPVACSRIRGNTDLISKEQKTLFDPYSEEDCKSAIEKLVYDDGLRRKCSIENSLMIKQFDVMHVYSDMMKIYGVM